MKHAKLIGNLIQRFTPFQGRHRWFCESLCIMLLSGVLPCRLSAQPTTDTRPAEKVLGVLLFDRFEMLDACGPLEVWGNLKGKVRTITVAQKAGPLASVQGPQLVADFGFDDCPKLDLLLVPGGIGAMKLCKDKATLAWLQKSATDAEITMSVCNGASILAASGLLNARPATTNKAYWKLSTSTGPKVLWKTHARWVDDGNIVTSSGVSAGIDMSLHVVSRLYGLKIAEHVANEMEYDWHRNATWDPFADLHGLPSSP